MKKMKRDGGGGGGDSWLNTYADLVTLLLTFFILLFTMSSVDAEKWQILVKAFASDGETSQVVLVKTEEGDGLITTSGDKMPQMNEAAESTELIDFNQLYEYIKKYIEENDLSASISLEKGANSVYIRFQDNVFFDPDQSVLKKDSLPLLTFMGDCFLAVDDQILSIRINGHTATVPGTVKKPGFDRSLSSDRANAVLLFFEEEKKIDPRKLISIGYGRNYPIADNNTEEGRIQNRRVEIMVMSNEFDLNEESDLYKFMTGQIGANLFEDEENPDEVMIPETSPDITDIPAASGETEELQPDITQPPQAAQPAEPEPTVIYEDVSPFDD